MKSFRTTLVSGSKPPYTSSTFLIIPAELAVQWGAGQIAVRGTISGTKFRRTASRGEGQLRFSIPRELRKRAGVAVGDTVDVAIELDPNPRPLSVPEELTLRTLRRSGPLGGQPEPEYRTLEKQCNHESVSHCRLS